MMSKSFFGLAAMAIVARAQTIETSSASSVAASATVSETMPPAATQAFNIANVTSTEKFNWCHAQLNTCPQICGGSASTNRCDEETLVFSCICPNGTVPDSTAYTETVPFFVCQQTYIQCIAAHPNDAEGQATCKDNEQCGSRNATAEALSATSASSSPTASSIGSSSASGSATEASSTASPTSSGNAAVVNTQQVTTGVFSAMILAAFGFLL